MWALQCVEQSSPDPAGGAGRHTSSCAHNWSASPPASERDPTGTSGKQKKNTETQVSLDALGVLNTFACVCVCVSEGYSVIRWIWSDYAQTLEDEQKDMENNFGNAEPRDGEYN